MSPQTIYSWKNWLQFKVYFAFFFPTLKQIKKVHLQKKLPAHTCLYVQEKLVSDANIAKLRALHTACDKTQYTSLSWITIITLFPQNHWIFFTTPTSIRALKSCMACRTRTAWKHNSLKNPFSLRFFWEERKYGAGMI